MICIQKIKIGLFSILAIVILLFAGCKTPAIVQKSDEVKISQKMDLDFPFDALGYWTGNLEIFRDTGKVQEVNMAVLIGESTDPTVYTWQIIYNPKKDNEDRRNYLLLTVDSETGHYQIDEDNGIILDCFLLDNKLISTFSVSGSLLTTINTFIGEEMVFEVIVGPIKEINTTGDIKVGENVIPPVNSYNTSTYQRAILSRIRG